MVKLKPPLTVNQQIALAIVPKCSAALSMLGSGYIIVHILVGPERRRRVYHRILLGMGLMDVVFSFTSFLSMWPLPKGTAWGAVGTTQTCTAAGFFGQGSGLASPLYNGSLTLYYFLTIRNRARWKEERMRSIEPWLHAVPLVVAWSTALAGLLLKLYNPIGWTCWIGPWPLQCQQTYEFGYTTCVRGDNAYIYRYAFFHGELWLTFFLTFLGMVYIYRFVASAGGGRPPGTVSGVSTGENDRAREGSTSRQSRKGKHTREVMVQAALFVAAFYLTWIFPTITFTTQLVSGETFTIVLFLQATFVPLQGSFNAIIYLRPRYLRHREGMPEEGALKAFWRTLKGEAPPARIVRSSTNMGTIAGDDRGRKILPALRRPLATGRFGGSRESRLVKGDSGDTGGDTSNGMGPNTTVNSSMKMEEGGRGVQWKDIEEV